MSLNNQRGETLVETVVSMAILAIVLITTYGIISFSTLTTRHSLDRITAINNEIRQIYTPPVDFSASEQSTTSIGLTFSISATDGETVVAPGSYVIASDITTYITDSGLIVFEESP